MRKPRLFSKIEINLSCMLLFISGDSRGKSVLLCNNKSRSNIVLKKYFYVKKVKAWRKLWETKNVCLLVEETRKTNDDIRKESHVQLTFPYQIRDGANIKPVNYVAIPYPFTKVLWTCVRLNSENPSHISFMRRIKKFISTNNN